MLNIACVKSVYGSTCICSIIVNLLALQEQVDIVSASVIVCVCLHVLGSWNYIFSTDFTGENDFYLSALVDPYIIRGRPLRGAGGVRSGLDIEFWIFHGNSSLLSP